MGTLLITLASFAAGAINSIAGGGTFITFPVLTYFGPMTEKAANVTSTIGLWPGSVASVFAARADIRRVPKGILVTFSLISLIGGASGAELLMHTSAKAFGLVIPWLMAFATLIFAFSKPIARWSGRHQGEPTVGWTIIVGCVQIAIAVYGGYFGAGIGVLMLAGLSFAGLNDIHLMNGLKVLLATLINGISVIIFLLGPVEWRLIPPMVVASVTGGFLGMYAARRIKPDLLRSLILLVGVLLSIAYFVKNYR